ncbi:GerAB/ArcD/ProY family transporter [Bacillus sp. AFS041924]|uniref:GerAB/ArcD/ProY family transporter n=1 Tax=Bacillus sp. AFS041924 TaxID=2033503 RepID=UPI000BFB5313|nr:GerAB/ArcD/ProY family transporter [Bacillus sp. AFS041924]PGS48448.1 spore gernimation protein GerH [Bacillus sp. AFS041924]
MATYRRQQVSPYLLFFIITSSQIGVGVLGFQRIIAKNAGYDAWISVIIAGIFIHLIVWFMYKLLTNAQGDIIDAHKQLFGKIIGATFSLIILVYYLIAAISVLRLYIEIVQVWMFPTLQTWLLAIIILLLCYYIISGGFRVVVGIAFLSGISTALLYTLLFHLPHKYIHMDNVLPIFDHSFKDLLMSAKQTIYTMAGFEILLMVFPFIRNGNSSQKFAQWGVAFSTLIFTLSAFTTFLLLSEKQIEHVIWSRIYIAKLIQFPFLERFEYILISSFIIKVISILTLLLWSTSRGLKLIFKWKQKYTLILISLISLFVCQLLKTRYEINIFADYTSRISLYIFYIYIPLLSIIFMFKKSGKAT